MITSLVVSGYRSIGPELRLDVGPVVCLYGKNGAGKSNVLRAVRLLGALMREDLSVYRHPAPVNAEAWFERHGEDPWMFATSGSARAARLECTTSSGATVGFEIGDDEGAITVQLTAWRQGERDFGEQLKKVAEAEDFEDWLGVVQEDPTVLDELQSVWDALRSELHVTSDLIAAELPVPQDVRDRVAALASSVQRNEIKRFRRLSEWIVRLAPPGSTGHFRDVSNPPVHPRDFAWIDDQGVMPLDSLGSGFQALFLLLAGLLDGTPSTPGPAAIALLEEPENRLHPPLQTQIVAMLRDLIAEKVVRQLWIATHSVALAAPGFTCLHLKRHEGVTSVRTISSEDLRQIELHVEGTGDSTVSVVNADHQIRLPSYVLEGLHAGPGSLVYFVREGNGFRLVAEEELESSIGLAP